MVQDSGVDYCTKRSNTYGFIDPLKSNFNGKSVFITAGAKGLGLAAAISFAKAGASIIGVTARIPLEDAVKTISSAATEAKRDEPKVLTYNVDVTDVASVEKAAQQFAADAGGRLDILVNNAGYLSHFVPMLESDPEDWCKNWDVNIRGTYLVSRFFLPIMLKDAKSERTIVNVSSQGAQFVRPGGSGYSGSKLALLRFTEYFGVEYGDQGVLSFAVHPGAAPTDLGQKFSSKSGMAMNDKPEVFGDSIVFLTSEKREWLQGRYVNCTWDMEELVSKKDNIVKNDWLKVRMKIG